MENHPDFLQSPLPRHLIAPNHSKRQITSHLPVLNLQQIPSKPLLELFPLISQDDSQECPLDLHLMEVHILIKASDTAADSPTQHQQTNQALDHKFSLFQFQVLFNQFPSFVLKNLPPLAFLDHL